MRTCLLKKKTGDKIHLKGKFLSFFLNILNIRKKEREQKNKELKRENNLFFFIYVLCI